MPPCASVSAAAIDRPSPVPPESSPRAGSGAVEASRSSATGRREQPVGVRGDQYVQIETGLNDRDQVVLGESGTGEFPDGSRPEG